MRARARLHHPCVSASGDTSTHLVVTVEGDTNPDGLRPCLTIIPVVDRSGSMGVNHKLRIVTASLGHLSGYLGDDDRVALVSFDDTVITHLEPVVADPAGMSRLQGALAEIGPQGSTNLTGGISAGLAAARKAAGAGAANMIIRVIVLTDGRANVGDYRPETLLGLVSDLPAQVSVSFMGVGDDCDHDLLGRLAEAGGGSYGFIESADRAADVLGAEIGGLLHTAASSVTVTVWPRAKYATADAPLASRYESVEGGFGVQLGNLVEGAARHVVFPVTLSGPGRAHARPVSAFDVKVTALVDDATLSVELLPKAHFGAVGAAVGDLDEIVELAVLADAQARAEEAARAGRFDVSTQVLSSLQTTTPSASVLRDWMTANYADVHAYGSSAVDRRSSLAALSNSGGLVGSSTSFDALASRTIGGYTTDAQRDVANETHVAVADALGMSSRPGRPFSLNAQQLAEQLSPVNVVNTGDVLWSGVQSTDTLGHAEYAEMSDDEATVVDGGEVRS